MFGLLAASVELDVDPLIQNLPLLHGAPPGGSLVMEPRLLDNFRGRRVVGEGANTLMVLRSPRRW